MLLSILFAFSYLTCVTNAQSPTTFSVTFDTEIESKPIAGRVLIFLSNRNPNPISGPAWFGPEPFFAIDVTDFKPGDTVTIDDSAASFPKPISQIKPGSYNVQAILDHSFYQAKHSDGEGNFFSAAQKLDIAADSGPIELKLSRSIPPKQHTDSQWVKFVATESKLLRDFHGRPVTERAMVVLPKSYYESPEKKYPTYYIITGFGGTLPQLQRRWQRGQQAPPNDQAEFIRIYLTGQCKWGHHVYANSATNGPRGDCLVKETIPLIDEQFRTIAAPTARFVGGHSSGGWSSLWLQVAYPNTFGGVWSTAPDPVDFRDWQGTNIYAADANVYRDAEGNKMPLARVGGQVVAYYEDFSKMDNVMGSGGQIRSFDAVFSPLAADGKPAYLWDRATGNVDPKILEHWKKYDISQILADNWPELQPQLAGKLHVYMGELDTFYLQGATELLGERLKKLGSDAVIEIFPDKDHSNLLNRALRNRIADEMTRQFRKHHSE